MKSKLRESSEMGLPHTDNRFYEKRHNVLFKSFYQHLKTLIDLFCSDRVFI